MDRIILHCDMNNYFASVEEKYDRRLKNIPFAVCGDPEMRHSIVMARNSLAKKYGVISGISFKQAKELCPSLQYIKADYPKYLRETKEARKIYYKYTDRVIPYGLDEAWLDLSDTGISMSTAKQIADIIRLEIFYSRELSASVGVSDNLIFSKLGSDYKKPNATTLITKENYRDIVWSLPSSDLLFVGERRKKLLASFGIQTIGDIANSDEKTLSRLLGKVGSDLKHFANGDDRSFHPENDEIKSIGNTITPPEDIFNNEDAFGLIYLLSSAVSLRLKKHGLSALSLTIIIKDNKFNSFTRRMSLHSPTDSSVTILSKCRALFLKSYNWTFPLRSLGIRADNLIPSAPYQLSLFMKDEKIDPDTEKYIEKLINRLGKLDLERSAAVKDEDI